MSTEPVKDYAAELVEREDDYRWAEANGDIGDRGFAAFDLAVALGRLDRDEAAIERYREAADLLAGADPPDIELIDTCDIGLLGSLLSLKRFEEALAICTRMIAEEHEFPGAPDNLGAAYECRYTALEGLGRFHEAYDAAQDLIDRFGPGVTPIQQQWVTTALFCQGRVAEKYDRDDLALQAIERALQRETSDDDILFCREVAIAMLMRGSLLERVGRRLEALDSYTELVERFGKSKDSEIGLNAAKAQGRKVRLGLLRRLGRLG